MINILATAAQTRPAGLAGNFMDFGRSLLAFLDGLGYNILAFVYNIFFSVASAEILSASVVVGFYQRIQLILGVFMMFKLALSIINVIINPDSIKDNQKGLSKIVTRVVVSLFLLLLIIPINTTDTIPDPSDNSLEAKIASNGILFGYLYKFQDSMMRENIIGKLILGTAANTRDPNDPETYIEDYQLNPGEAMIATVARAFVQPAVTDNTQPFCKNSSDEDYDENDPCPNVICPTQVADSDYMSDEFNGLTVANIVNLNCDENGSHVEGNLWDATFGARNAAYAFNYMPLGGLICSVIMIIIILGFTVDVAVRSIKLALLRLIAPIPIISYIDPKGKDEGAFNNWVKVLVSTYLDLFVRLMIIYFGAFCIQQIATGGINLGDAFSIGTAEGLFAVVFLIIGVLFFMKQAPAFLRQVLGIKGAPMSNIGLSAVLGGLGGLRGGGAAAASAAFDSANAANEAYTQQKSGQPFRQYSMARDNIIKKITGDKDAEGGARGFLHRWSGNNLASRYGVNDESMSEAKRILKDREDELSNLQLQKEMLGNRMKQANVSSADSNEDFANFMNSSGVAQYVNPKTGQFIDSTSEGFFKARQPDLYKEFSERYNRNKLYNDYADINKQVIEAQRAVSEQQDLIKDAKEFRSTTTVRPETYTRRQPFNPDASSGNTANDGDTDLYAANIDLHDHGPHGGGGPRPGGGPPLGRP